MNTARSGAGTALLPDGSVLITGGEGAYGAIASAELYGLSGAVSVAPSMSIARSKHTSVALADGRVLVIGGRTTGDGATAAAEIYDAASRSWTRTGSMNMARSGATATLLNSGRVLVSGGEAFGSALASMEEFDASTGVFTDVYTPMSSPRNNHAAALLSDGRVLITGGDNGAAALDSADLYNPETRSITPANKMAAARRGHTATSLLDGRVLVAGGSNGSAELASAEIYDPENGSFAAAGNLLTARQGHQAFRIPGNNTVVLAGGVARGKALSAAEQFIPWRGVFASLNDLSESRRSHSGAATLGNLLIVGGANESGALRGSELLALPTITTDKGDYLTGENVILRGTGWQAGATVKISLRQANMHQVLEFSSVADANGSMAVEASSQELDATTYAIAGSSSSDAATRFTVGAGAADTSAVFATSAGVSDKVVQKSAKNLNGPNTATPTVVPGSVTSCTVGFTTAPIYPYASTNSLTNTAFSESEVLRAVTAPGDHFNVFYNDEHALALGVRQTTVKTSSGSTIYSASVTPQPASVPGIAAPPALGFTDSTGNDVSGRPLRPSLFLTDVTTNPNSTAGDWQSGGIPIGPNAVYGTWKAFTTLIDQTKTPNTVTLTADGDGTKTNWSIGSGGNIDPVPANLSNEGYGTEIQWNISSLNDPAGVTAANPSGLLIPGHIYRMQVIDHDGDQNKGGGDAGEDCRQVTIANPLLSVVKSSTTTLVTAAGQVIPYSYLVKNIGNVTVNNIAVTDPNTGNTMSCPATSLPPSPNSANSMTCTASHTVLQSEIDNATGGGACPNNGEINTVTVVSDAPTVMDTHCIPIQQNPKLKIVKTSSDPKAITAYGQKVTYTYTLTNTGNTTLTGIALTDTNVDAAPVCLATTLAPGAVTTCSATHTVTLTEMNACKIDNTVSFTVTSTPSATLDPASVTGLSITPACHPVLTVVKDSTTQAVTTAGQVIPYSYLVTNTGNQTVNNIVATDPNTGGTMSCPATSLPPSPNPNNLPNSMTCTASHTVLQSEIDNATGGGNCPMHGEINTVTVTSTAPTVMDTHCIPIQQNPKLQIVKSATGTSNGTNQITAAGQSINYQFLVTTTGSNVDVNNIVVTDAQVSPISCPATSLPPNGSMTCTGSHTVTQPELNVCQVINSASVSGKWGSANTVVNASSNTVTLTNLTSIKIACAPAIHLEKSANVGNTTPPTLVFNTAGQVVTYTYTITNIGNVDLPGPFTITDNKPLKIGATSYAANTPFPCVSGGILLGGSANCTANYTVTSADLTSGSVTNLAFAKTPAVPPSNNATATVLGPCVLSYNLSPTTSRTSVAFNESAVLRTGFLDTATNNVVALYSDEHALTLGVKTLNGTTDPTFSDFTPDGTHPYNFRSPVDFGFTGAQGAVDANGRPLYPAAFVTDLGTTSTLNPKLASGDWQQAGGFGIGLGAVYGTWKGETLTGTTTTVASDPAKNTWGGLIYTPPKGFAAYSNEGYGAEAVWTPASLGLQSGHFYRVQFMVHDGDQNKTGGDVGQACVTIYKP